MSVPIAVDVLDYLTGSYRLDPVHSRLGFAVRHAMVATVHGGFDSFDGGVYLDAGDPTRSVIELRIDAASINTNNPDRDAHLRSADFFDVELHPSIDFRSADVVRVDERRYSMSGDLTIKGVTRMVGLQFVYQGSAIDPYGQLRVGFEGSGSFNRSDWDLTWNVPLKAGGLVVSDRIKLELDVSAIKIDAGAGSR